MIFKSNNSLKTLTSVLLMVFLFNSCGTDSNDINPDDVFVDGIHEEILETLDEEMIDTIENELNMPIHRGSNPPLIDSFYADEMDSGNITFVMAPNIQESTNVPTDGEMGRTFFDNYIRLSNQNPARFTIDFDRAHIDIEPFYGDGAYIIGENNRFSVFAIQMSDRPGGVAISMNIFSVIMTPNGVEEPHYAFFMVDDSGGGGFIPNGTGRTFIDDERIARIASWPH